VTREPSDVIAELLAVLARRRPPATR
jgi:hypothetical protein